MGGCALSGGAGVPLAGGMMGGFEGGMPGTSDPGMTIVPGGAGNTLPLPSIGPSVTGMP